MSIKKLLKYSLYLSSVGLIFGLLFAGMVLYFFGFNLPNHIVLKNYEPDITTRLYSCNGEIFAEYASEKRVFVPIEHIPDKLQYAFIAAEDKSFFNHLGFDIFGIAKAALKNFKRLYKKQRLVGASTITQQVARNFLLEENIRKVSWRRKIQETILAFRMETVLSKEKILELYLNKIFLGKGAYGVAAASLQYFNCGLNELSLAQCATLASFPKAPSRYYKNKELALKRRNWVLKQMYKSGFISEDEMIKSQQDHLVYKNRKIANSIEDGYFAESVRQKLVESFGKQVLYKRGLVVRCAMNSKLQQIATEAFRESLMAYDKRHGFRGPLTRISLPCLETAYLSYPTVDATITFIKKWKQALKKFINFPKPKAALKGWKLALVQKVTNYKVIIFVRDNGRLLLSYIPLKNLKWAKRYLTVDEVGFEINRATEVLSKGDVVLVDLDEASKSTYKLQQIPEVSGALLVMNAEDGKILAMTGGFNYQSSQFNRALQAQRQVGSALKPFIALKAFEVTNLTPASLINDDPISVPLGTNIPNWQPRNNSRRNSGDITLRRMLASSYNVAFVRLVYEVLGLERAGEIISRFGIYDTPPKLFSFILGAKESTLVRVAGAYASILNGGLKVEPTLIERIQDRHGKTIFTHNRSVDKNFENEWNKSITIDDIPTIKYNRKRLTSKVNAYQTISLLEGVARYGTALRSYKKLKRVFGGKTGGSNSHRSVWFIGILPYPKWVVATYIGFDQTTKALGEKEGATKAALPIFTNFVKKALKNVNSRPFLVPEGIDFFEVRFKDGILARPEDKKDSKRRVITESFKKGQKPDKMPFQDELIY